MKKRFNQDGGEIIRLKVPKKLENSQVVKALREQSKRIVRAAQPVERKGEQ